MVQSPIVEVCVDSIESVWNAHRAGAARVEICSNLPEGGVTPSNGLCNMANDLRNLEIYALIRPRTGDFHYNSREVEAMIADARYLSEGRYCNGFSIGALDAEGAIDKEPLEEIIEIAGWYKMGITLHRAFDRSRDLFEALEDAISLGCKRVLTSGGMPTAIEGADVIKKLVKQAKNRIKIVAASGITPENVAELIKKTGVKEVHGTFKSTVKSKMQYKNPAFANDVRDYQHDLADEKKIKKVVHCKIL